MPVDFEQRGRVAVLVPNRPETLTAVSPEVIGEIHERLAPVEGDAGLRAVVITGGGEMAFVAGADIGHIRTASVLEARAYAEQGHALMNRIEAFSRPVIAAVNGFALGGGCELALACDIRLASENAVFGLPEVSLGIFPGWGGTQRLTHATSLGIAKGIIVTGAVFRPRRPRGSGRRTRSVRSRS
jgi:enoyl-CoA hydratase